MAITVTDLKVEAKARSGRVRVNQNVRIDSSHSLTVYNDANAAVRCTIDCDLIAEQGHQNHSEDFDVPANGEITKAFDLILNTSFATVGRKEAKATTSVTGGVVKSKSAVAVVQVS